jgi:ribonuclease-3
MKKRYSITERIRALVSPDTGVDPERARELKELCRALGIRVKDLSLLDQALSHRSYVHEQVLGLVVNEALYGKYAKRQEGRLTKIKSLLVSETVLSRRAEELDLGRYIHLSDNERISGGANRSSILADAFEAVIAAIYLDSGLEGARSFIENHILSDTEKLLNVEEYKNYKSVVQEHAQKKMGARPRYRVVSATGPEHERKFFVELKIDGRALGRGEGKNKKEAEQMAARNALLKLGLLDDGTKKQSRRSSSSRRGRRGGRRRNKERSS